ncbi:hypothetical protein [Jeotgalibaca arthritidis]|uniref:DegT/DnrJ/EryC1/StrS aminotransferase family protein n=1 Tax=Jeotgalibaca arthritidis TaxID=1868794 RepID=A0A6G7KB39_9LACT|nr:hypothetical protein [Jeotgalibaca arthritidis]QII82421.1 hypothetical protein G7057_08215 [Jeotgalibaca arthritidis]
MREIGGYFELDQFINKPYHNNMIELNTGRNALAYLIKAKGIKKVYIPHYLCNSVSGVLKMLSVDYEGYSIDKNFNPLFDKKLEKDQYLYIVNYYGQISNSSIRSFKEQYGAIIIDNTQSFFQKPVQGIDTIYSLRKYFGIPDGAYLSTDKILEEKLEEEKSGHRMNHILGRFEGEASTYYNDFRRNDESFKTLPLKKVSRISRNILGAIDYEAVRLRRNKNFQFLNEILSASNHLNISVPEGPFAYPYYAENGIEIRKKLARKKIYIPTLWPNVLQDKNEKSIEYDYAANILPLPCDQRYGLEDMECIVREINNL